MFFTTILVVGINLSARRVNTSVKLQHASALKRMGILGAGVIAIFIGLFALLIIIMVAFPEMTEPTVPGYEVSMTVLVTAWLWLIGFTLGYLMCFVKERSWALISSLLFLFMVACLLALPLSRIPEEEWLASG